MIRYHSADMRSSHLWNSLLLRSWLNNVPPGPWGENAFTILLPFFSNRDIRPTVDLWYISVSFNVTPNVPAEWYTTFMGKSFAELDFVGTEKGEMIHILSLMVAHNLVTAKKATCLPSTETTEWIIFISNCPFITSFCKTVFSVSSSSLIHLWSKMYRMKKWSEFLFNQVKWQVTQANYWKRKFASSYVRKNHVLGCQIVIYVYSIFVFSRIGMADYETHTFVLNKLNSKFE